MTTAVILQAAYVLHYRQYGDNNFIVDLFSLEHGLVPLMARGARSSKPRVRALYQPFRPLLVSWLGERELRTLTGIEESGKAAMLDGVPLACAYYLNEIMLRLLPRDQAHPNLFAHYALALSQLGDEAGTPERPLRAFELHLLDALGLLPDFAYCAQDGEAIDATTDYLYYPGNSVAVAQLDQKSKSVLHADGMTEDTGIAVSGKTLLALAAFNLDSDTVLEEIKPLMRRVLRIHLGDKPLRSHELFKTLTPPPPPPPAA